MTPNETTEHTEGGKGEVGYLRRKGRGNRFTVGLHIKGPR